MEVLFIVAGTVNVEKHLPGGEVATLSTRGPGTITGPSLTCKKGSTPSCPFTLRVAGSVPCVVYTLQKSYFLRLLRSASQIMGGLVLECRSQMQFWEERLMKYSRIKDLIEPPQANVDDGQRFFEENRNRVLQDTTKAIEIETRRGAGAYKVSSMAFQQWPFQALNDAHRRRIEKIEEQDQKESKAG